MRKVKEKNIRLDNIPLSRNKKNQNHHTKFYVQNNLNLLPPRHITMLLYLLWTPMVYISTFQSRPSSLIRRELAKIQHHARMDHTTCNNEKDTQ